MKKSAARGIGVVLCLMLAFALSPAAHAAFTSLTSATTSFSTVKLVAPAAELTNVTITCGLASLTITVKDYGQVTYANYHEVILYRGTETTPVFVGDLSQESGRSYRELVRTSNNWRTEIRGRYKVKDSTNVWDGPPLKHSLSC